MEGGEDRDGEERSPRCERRGSEGKVKRKEHAYLHDCSLKIDLLYFSGKRGSVLWPVNSEGTWVTSTGPTNEGSILNMFCPL